MTKEREALEQWLQSPRVDEETKRELFGMKEDEDAVKASFLHLPEFGTAGLRGVMGPGTARMNRYTVGLATQGMAEVIKKAGKEAMARGVAIACDCRHHSMEFSSEAACVLAANGIRAYLFESLRPTPELSFAVRFLHCIGGINITASHNPKEYNGYKAYWEDGAQMDIDHSSAVSAEMSRLDIFDDVRSMKPEEAKNSGLVTMIGAEVDEAYIQAVLAEAMDRACTEQADLPIVYTAFHGAGCRIIPEILHRRGLKRVYPVPQQQVNDGDFPTVKSPNPEYREGFALAMALADEKQAELIIGSDPDADRTGVLVRDKKGGWLQLSGNQTGILLCAYIIEMHQKQGTMPPHPVVIKSIVSSAMIDAICKKNGVACRGVYTGFKHIGAEMLRLEQEQGGEVIFGYEESYGYLKGIYCRDKDAPNTAMMMAEMACHYRLQGKTLQDVLEALYREYGYYGELTLQVEKQGLAGAQRIAQIMQQLHKAPPQQIGGEKIVQYRDYLNGVITDTTTGNTQETGFYPMDVLFYHTESGSDVIVRPSGTEPKIKCYVLTKGATEAECDKNAERLMEWGRQTLA